MSLRGRREGKGKTGAGLSGVGDYVELGFELLWLALELQPTSSAVDNNIKMIFFISFSPKIISNYI